MRTVSIVVPFYNEEKCISFFFERMYPVINNIKDSMFEIVCVDDGSIDETLEILKKYQIEDPRIKIVELSRNFGKESALTAGLDEAYGDAAIPIDADLQDPPELIVRLIHYWDKGYDVVLAKRTDRSTDSFFKRFTAGIFYKLHNKLSSVKIPDSVGDFRLMDRVVIDSIKKLPENQRFMKGIFAWVGFKTYTINYKRTVRSEGYTKFNGLKLLDFAIDGIINFSTIPLRVFSIIGILGVIATTFYAAVIIIKAVLFQIPVPGFASIILAILFFGNIQLIGIGVLGEYMGRNYIESKRRPNYIIRKVYK